MLKFTYILSPFPQALPTLNKRNLETGLIDIHKRRWFPPHSNLEWNTLKGQGTVSAECLISKIMVSVVLGKKPTQTTKQTQTKPQNY